MAADGSQPSAELFELAPAKVNLTLRVTARRADGYHELCSLVCFANIGDDLRLAPATALGLSVDGDTAAQSGAVSDNLVLKAARALQERIEGLRVGRFHLTKRLPVAAGLGGGSADAAAALRLLARLNEIAPGDWRLTGAARTTGADVPVCLDPRPRVMRGIGELLSAPLPLPTLDAVLVNPRVACPTGPVFQNLSGFSDTDDAAANLLESGGSPNRNAVIEALLRSSNDLEAPAVALVPAIAAVLTSLRDTEGCRLARMSGSGATSFGLFESAEAAGLAATRLQSENPGWWVKSVVFGGTSVA